MKTKHLVLLMLAVFLATFTGCKKYEDGPGFSPWPKKMRIVNVWKVDETIINGVSTAGNNDYTVEFKSNGKVEYKWTSGGSSITTEDEWEWGDKKESIKVTSGSNITESFILRLTSSEFWIENADKTVEVHYETAK